jgi:hypothetical protein
MAGREEDSEEATAAAVPSPHQQAGMAGAGSGSSDHVEGSGSAYATRELEDSFEDPNPFGEEESNLDFSEETEELIGEVRWLALFKIHTPKAFSHVAMFK